MLIKVGEGGEAMAECTVWDPFQVHFAVDYSLARWHWQFDRAALIEHRDLKR